MRHNFVDLQKCHSHYKNFLKPNVFQETVLELDLEFWILLCCEFEVHEQLTSLIKILQFLLALPKEKEDGRFTLYTVSRS